MSNWALAIDTILTLPVGTYSECVDPVSEQLILLPLQAEAADQGT
jgi:hypothetical protein